MLLGGGERLVAADAGVEGTNAVDRVELPDRWRCRALDTLARAPDLSLNVETFLAYFAGAPTAVNRG